MSPNEYQGSNFNRFDSGIMTGSEVKSKYLTGMRGNHRQHQSDANGKAQEYYEDEIDSETEVFFDPSD
jgi:hypothetical protein